MRYRVLDFLRCPLCPAAKLDLRHVEEHEDLDVVPGAFPPGRQCSCRASRFFTPVAPGGCVCWTVRISAGELVCASCGTTYAIRDGIPRMRPLDVRHSDELRVVQEKTSNSFGFEWNHFHDLGWRDTKEPSSTESKTTKDIERQSFLTKALAIQPEFSAKLVLDAGCGNGRYSYQARQFGAEVIGVDLSNAVDAAGNNLRRYPDVHIVQGDIVRLPLAPEIFDQIFSIGVLMHTGAAKRAFASIVKHLKPEGVVAITVYRKGNAIYEFVDRELRKRTVDMDYARLMRLSKQLAGLARAAWMTRRFTLGRPVLYSLLNCIVRLESKTHNVFDWYSAPVASHHTYPEVYEWFAENNCEVLGDRNRNKNVILRVLSSPAGGVTVKGRKRAAQPQPVEQPTVERIA